MLVILVLPQTDLISERGETQALQGRFDAEARAAAEREAAILQRAEASEAQLQVSYLVSSYSERYPLSALQPSRSPCLQRHSPSNPMVRTLLRCPA